jgi:A/G-specific adenine glycosylase
MKDISKVLTDWYTRNKRDLPWRETKNPYNIWVSEIILQQTRINQGLSYYYAFIDKFPDIYALANSDIDDLLKIWQGLGYYSRARNMHFTAKDIIENYKGIFPKEYAKLIKLKGIGDYTASAIASISFNEGTPVLDGNVFRVLARLFGISESTQTKAGKDIFKNKARKLMSNHNPGIFNQALMEFGSLQCTPLNPNCSSCPLASNCFAFKNDLINSLPAKKQKAKQTIRYFNYLYIIYGNNTFIEKRTRNDIWKLLYEIPLIETDELLSLSDLINNKKFKELFGKLSPTIEPQYIDIKHILSHQKLYSRFYRITIDQIDNTTLNEYIKTPINKLSDYSMSALLQKYFNLLNK